VPAIQSFIFRNGLLNGPYRVGDHPHDALLVSAIAGLTQICQLAQQLVYSPGDVSILRVQGPHRDQFAANFKKIKLRLKMRIAVQIFTVASLSQDFIGADLFELTI
jgi:hypothetical protein